MHLKETKPLIVPIQARKPINFEYWKQLSRREPEIHLGWSVRQESCVQLGSFMMLEDALSFARHLLLEENGRSSIVIESEQKAREVWRREHGTKKKEKEKKK